MRYLFFILLFVIGYLLIHIYYSFCQNLPLAGKVATMAIISLIVLLSFGMYPAEWALNIKLAGWLKLILNISVGFFVTLSFIYMLTDVLKLIHLYPSTLKTNETLDGIILVGISVIMCIVGYINNQIPTTTNYTIESPKITKPFTIAVISDLHIGSFNMSPNKLNKAVKIINNRHPDMVFIAGDIFDGRSPEVKFLKDDYISIFKKLKAKHGVFAVTGNHEYYLGNPKKAINLFKTTGIPVLQDETAFIKELNTTIIGRDDKNKTFRLSIPSKPLPMLIPKDNSYKIVISHNPNTIEESIKSGADLQISGHTHNGQLFPINFIIKMLYQTSWGTAKTDTATLFVTSGLGMWGPPIRTAGLSEIAFITLVPSSPHQ